VTIGHDIVGVAMPSPQKRTIARMAKTIAGKGKRCPETAPK